MLTTDVNTVGTILVEPLPRNAQVDEAWDDSTLTGLFDSFAHCAPADDDSRQQVEETCLITFARYSRVITADKVETVICANRTKLLRELEVAYEQVVSRVGG